MREQTASPHEQRVKLRGLLEKPGLIVAPAAYDGFSARLVERVGFSAVYLTGNGMSGSILGQPDVGLMGLSEVAFVARNIVGCVDIPVLVDADTGYGNAINAIYTVRTLESAGVAAIQIEDQVNPKRCGHLPNARVVVGYDEAVRKIAAASSARHDRALVLIGRTDAAGSLGTDEALRRANAFLEAGADIAFIEHRAGRAELESISRRVEGPLLVNQDEAGRSADLSASDLEQIGVKVAIYPGLLRYAACFAMRSALELLRRDGSTLHARAAMVDFEEYNAILGLDGVKRLEDRFLPPAEAVSHGRG
ncbi:MAG: oxaloacetate decarboxylase [Candidatus Velthaea sp.]